MYIHDLMSRPVIVCKHHESLATAAKTLWEQDCGAVPVVGDDGALCGIITDRDICMAAYTSGRPLTEIPIASVMSKEIFSCMPQEDIATAERLMKDKRIRRLPIVNEHRQPVGMLSVADLARAAMRDDAERFGLTRAGALETLATVCEPRVQVTA